jgi:hypothetical protein
MSKTEAGTGRSLAKNWDIAVTSSALLVIVGGLAAPHIRRAVAALPFSRSGERVAADSA